MLNDQAGRPFGIVSGAGACARPTAAGSATRNRTVIEFDTAGRTKQVTGPTGRTTEVKYDPLGRVETVTDPRGITLFEYVGETRL